jgi:hypothetical protein
MPRRGGSRRESDSPPNWVMFGSCLSLERFGQAGLGLLGRPASSGESMFSLRNPNWRTPLEIVVGSILGAAIGLTGVGAGVLTTPVFMPAVSLDEISRSRPPDSLLDPTGFLSTLRSLLPLWVAAGPSFSPGLLCYLKTRILRGRISRALVLIVQNDTH